MNENVYRWLYLFLFAIFAISMLIGAVRKPRNPVPVVIIDPVTGRSVTFTDPRIPGVVEDDV